MSQNNVFAKLLMSWYRACARDLPWRRTKDPYRIWISEVMLQQTTVNAVIPFYQRWIRQFPNIQSVAQSSAQNILKAWQGLGYYSRARNIHATAKIIVKKFRGDFPSNKDILRSLPGFGPYTTGAVLSIAFDRREPIIDANVRRVIMRQLNSKGFADSVQDKKIFEFLDNVMPWRNMCIFNQALMELGALVCRSKNPRCLICPIRASCLAYKKGVVDIVPQPKVKAIKNVSAAIAVIRDKDKFFMQKRPAKGLFADLWEFPGGKIDSGETARQALVREVQEELSISIKIEKKLPNVIQFYTQFKATLFVWLCQPCAMPRTDKMHKWLKLSDLKHYPLSAGTAKIVENLEKIVLK
ncbi:MAG: A/G-specific adenine glycosylase [Candidatus Omnitrophica bacterium]|nr:A/G-specific adenine glycosylase [Candidatus Omnitrophota bacterium]